MKNIKIVFVLLIVFGVVGCSDFLEEVPKSFAAPENLYVDESGAIQGVTGAYAALQRPGVYNEIGYFLVTDVTRQAVWNVWGGTGTFVYTSENAEIILPLWRDHFLGVNEANAAISNIPAVDMDQDLKNRLLAEAKFIKSLLYFNLVRYFGDVPYRENEVSSLNDLEVPRDPASYIYERIIEDLEFGVEHLGVKGEVETGRATVDAAKTLLAKIYLTRGSMAKRDGTGDGKADFQKAMDYAKEVIDGGRYSLVEYYPDVFANDNKNNSEIIFDVQYMSGVGETSRIGMNMGINGQGDQLVNGSSWGNITATDYYSSMFDPTDIVRREWNTPWITVDGPNSLIEWENMGAGPQEGAQRRIGKFRRFPVRSASYNFFDHDTNWPVFRYAEVLLIYAEAINEVNDGPNSEVEWALNELRRRARTVNGDGTKYYLHYDVKPRDLSYDDNILPDIAFSTFDYAQAKKYIEDERARELGGEAKRWFDLVRWGKLVENVKFLLDYIPDGRSEPERAWSLQASNVDEHHMLLPIPNQEFQENTLMTQNPGY